MENLKLPILKPVYFMALCVFALAGMAVHQALRAPRIGIEEFGSGTAPMVVAVALLVLAVFMVIREATGAAPGAEDEAFADQAGGVGPAVVKGGLLAMVLAVYVVLLELTDLPFWVLSMIFLAVAARIIEGKMKKWLLLSLATSGLMAITIQVVFTQFLHVDLP